MKSCLALAPVLLLALSSCGPCLDPEGATSMTRKIDLTGRIYRCVCGDPEGGVPSSKEAAVIQSPVSMPADEMAAPAEVPASAEDAPADIPVVEVAE